MKKALFKPNSKIGENFEYAKLHEMLLKKINYFYKTYLRYLKKLNGVTDNSRILDLIKKDIEEYKETNLEKYKLSATNLGDKQYEELDLKNLMVVEFFRSLNGRNPFLKSSMQDENMEKYMNQEDKEEQVADHNSENLKNKQSTTNAADIDYIEDYLSFNDLSLKDKVEVLFFFCNYALTFSGRYSYFREELMKDSKDPINIHITYKCIKPLGLDSEENSFYSLVCNKDCRIYKEKADKTLELVVRNYSELEQFINNLELKCSTYLFIPENNLLKNIRENLLYYKEYDDEEQKRDISFNRKQQAFEKAKKLGNKPSGEVEKYQNSDYFLMNISDHVITRNQLNQITRVNLSQISLTQPQNNKPQLITEDDKKKIKIEKEKLERQKRLEKRNRILAKNRIQEEAFDEMSSDKITNIKNLNKKRSRSNRIYNRKNMNIRNKIGKRKFDSSSEDEFISNDDYSENSNDHNLKNSKENNTDSERDEENDGDYINENYNNNEEDSSSDIIIDGNLVYRYSTNQIELEGNWYMNADPSIKERVSYLFLKSNEFSDCYISKEEIVTDPTNNKNTSNTASNHTPYHRDFKIKICAANLIECILLNKIEVYDSVLSFLSGEYAGFFMYYGKTIEDRVNLNLSLQESLVRISGKDKI
jgi:hypothetical protein